MEESLHVHRCQSYQQVNRQIKQTTGELHLILTFVSLYRPGQLYRVWGWQSGRSSSSHLMGEVHPRIISLPFSSHAHHLIHCASYSADTPHALTLTLQHITIPTRLAGRLLGRAGSLPQGVAHSVRRRRAGCPPGAVASQHAHQPAPLERSCLLLPWLAPGDHAPTGEPPVTPSCPFCQPACQPLPLYSTPPGLA